jgi:ATP-dependent RNA helicase DDX24/MAK5
MAALCARIPDSPFIATVTGGLSVQKQQRLLSRANIIIGTPGRLWEVMSTRIELMAWLRQIRFLVLDEADRLLTEGHFNEVEEILDALDRRDVSDASDASDKEHLESEGVRSLQTLVFSATFHKGLQQKLAGKGKFSAELMDQKQSMEYLLKRINFGEEKPKFIDVNPVSQMAEGLREGIIECAALEKVNSHPPVLRFRVDHYYRICISTLFFYTILTCAF